MLSGLGRDVVEKECSDSKNTYRNKFALACIDGPIFSTKELSDAF